MGKTASTRVVRLLVILATLVTMVGAGSGTALAAGHMRSLKMGLPPFYSNALYHVASKQGFWKDEGLEVTLVELGGASQVFEAVLGGSLDFGEGGTGVAIALLARTGKIVVIAHDAYTDGTPPPELLVVKKDSPITDIKQLDGKKVAVHTKGTLSHILLEDIKRRFGINPVTLEIPAPSQWAALIRGDVDAVMNETPFPEQMKALGATYLYGLPNPDVVPYLSINVTLTTRDFAEKNPEVVIKVVKVILRTARWMMDNPEKVRAIISERLKFKEEVVKLIHPRSFKWSRNGVYLMPSIKWWGQRMQELNLLKQQPDYERHFVYTYIDAALKELGKVADPDYDRAIVMPIRLQ